MSYFKIECEDPMADRCMTRFRDRDAAIAEARKRGAANGRRYHLLRQEAIITVPEPQAVVERVDTGT